MPAEPDAASVAQRQGDHAILWSRLRLHGAESRARSEAAHDQRWYARRLRAYRQWLCDEHSDFVAATRHLLACRRSLLDTF